MNISKGKNSEYYEKLQDFLSKEGLFIEELD
jgi:hypothetical protein